MTRDLRLLTIMGSGETAPTMAKVHRMLFERLGPEAEGVLLDTPYGFQENADQISQRALAYFGQHLESPFSVATWRSAADDALQRERALARIRHAEYVFAGPGSPSYALEVWRDTPLRDILTEKLARRGCVTFASAAALTLGIAAVPVYEIYKVGASPHWLGGIDLLVEIGLCAAVIPHYDNAEGGNHDTRFCYLGERRLAMLEPLLPADAFVLGVDEHTASVFDLDAGTVTIVGRGAVTVRRRGMSTRFEAGSTVAIDALRTAAETARTAPVQAREDEPVASPMPSLLAEAERLEGMFDGALASRDVGAAVAAMLDLEQSMFEWSADTDETDEMDRARVVLRRMAVRLGEVAVEGIRDPREPIAPFVDALVELRARARAERSWELADMLRDRLMAAGIEVRDTPEGTTWGLSD
ncbi:MAG: CysS/YqeB C-terminal domain-containing protein [Egibacteraceae bacterium]